MKDVFDQAEKSRHGFLEILEAVATGDRRLINEVSLGRVYQHMQKSGEESLAILTAYRGGRARKENIAANKRLMGEIRSLGYGAFKLIGRWKECPDDNPDCEDHERVLVKEHSFGVVGLPKKDTERLTRKYDQDASVYLGPETDGKAVLIWGTGKSDTPIGKFSPGKVSDVYSQIRGSSFVFEGWEYPAQSYVEALIEQSFRRWSDKVAG